MTHRKKTGEGFQNAWSDLSMFYPEVNPCWSLRCHRTAERMFPATTSPMRSSSQRLPPPLKLA